MTTLGGACIICLGIFCKRHVTFRAGVPNCAACEEERRTRETTGGVSDDDVRRVASLLLHDMAGTLGPGHEGVVQEAAARIRLFSADPVRFEQKVVDDVQQFIHDCFVDTTWPACPYHPNHPLWYSQCRWRCERNDRAVAPLGGLFGRGHR